MTRVTFEYDHGEPRTVDLNCTSDQVDTKVQRLLNQLGNSFNVDGVEIPKNFSRYNFD